MAESSSKGPLSRFSLLQKRLKEERLFVRQEKDLMRSLNETLNKTSQDLFHLSWCTQQHWKNLDRLVLGSRVFPSECSKTLKCIEHVVFEDASKYLGYQEMRFGEFLNKLRESPKLIARVLMYTDSMKLDVTLVERLLLSSIYGSCLFKQEEKYVLMILKYLVDEQVVTSPDPLGFLCSPKSNAFSVMLKLFSNLLFSAKLYQTAALHGAVMQAIVEDNFYLDLEVNKMLSRFPPQSLRHKFGEPATPKATKKIGEFMDHILQFLVSLCKKFLRSLREKIYCFPPNLRWLIRQLYEGLMRRPGSDDSQVKAIIGYMLINYLVCPAVLNPEPYGINTDATVSEIARYNLSQVAYVLKALALSECGLKDPNMGKIIDKLEHDHNLSTPVTVEKYDGKLISIRPITGKLGDTCLDLLTTHTLARCDKGAVRSYVEAILKDSEELNPLLEEEPTKGVHRSAMLMTERELKALIFFLRHLQLQKDPKLMEAGIDQVLSLLPQLPRRWTKPKGQPRQAQSMPPLGQELQQHAQMAPVTPKQKRITIGKKHTSLYSPAKDITPIKDEGTTGDKGEGADENGLEDDIENLMKSLASVLTEEESVLVITLGVASGEEPGMLAEEKVLGLKHALPVTATFDMERSEEDKRKRASSLMLDALKDLSEGFLGSEEDLDKVKSIMSKIDEPTSEGSSLEKSSDEFTPKSVENGNLLMDMLQEELGETHAQKDAPSGHDVVDAWGVIPSNTEEKSRAQSELFSLSLSHTEVEAKTAKGGTAFGAALLGEAFVNSPFSDNFCPPSTKANSATDDNKGGALDDLLDFGFTNAQAQETNELVSPPERTTSNSSSASTNVSNHRLSQVSLDSVLGSINTVLKGASGPSAGSQYSNMEDRIHEAAEGVEGKSESNNNTKQCNRERSVTLNSNDSGEFFFGPWNRGQGKVIENEASDEKSVPLDESASSDDIREMFANVNPMDRSATGPGDVNLRRKKSSGMKFKDKIVSGFRQARSKSDGQNLKKEGKRHIIKQIDLSDGRDEPAIPEDRPPDDKASSIVSRTPRDISEDILQKYRRLTHKTAGLMEDEDNIQPGEGAGQGFTETEWDDAFKFEDAKRKLRIVLCMADRSHFPSGTSNCSQLLMTFLQSQLAEAVNLQDRSFVAQLHETLRSVRQVPSNSCEKLLEALEEDYRQRAPYVAYLIRSKQHLLATISHLEQLFKKVERDKNICSKYFTTVCVRLFLETPEKRRELVNFSMKFEATNMLDEKCALVEEFLEHLYSEMTRDPTWISATDEQWSDCQMATERSLMSIIYKDAFYPNGETDIENDRIFHEHIGRLTKFVTVNHKELQIPKVYQKEAPWPSAQTELLMINAYKTPVDKLRCIHRCCITIMNLLSMATDDSAPGADDFVPVLVFVVIRANPPNLLSTKQYVNNFYEKRLSGEEYYCWMQFCAAVEFIKSLDDRRR